jgi:hypothetical protein
MLIIGHSRRSLKRPGFVTDPAGLGARARRRRRREQALV